MQCKQPEQYLQSLGQPFLRGASSPHVCETEVHFPAMPKERTLLSLI